MFPSPAPTGPPRITIGNPGDLLAMIPYLLGFHPTDSMVAVGMRDHSVVFTLRLDLPAPAGHEPPDGETSDAPDRPGPWTDPDRLVAVLSAQSLTGVILAGFGPDERVRPASTRFGESLRAAGLPLLDRLRAEDDRYWSYECADPTCCPATGTQYGARQRRVAAEATVAGLVALPSRETLAGHVAPVRGAERRAMDEATDRAEARCVALIESTGGPHDAVDELIAEGLAAVRAAVTRYRSDPDRPETAQARLSDDEVAWLGVVLSSTRIRDEAWTLVDGADLAGHRALWTDVVRRVHPDYVPAPAALLGFVSWQAGDTAFGGIALGRALEADPAYPMALMLAQVMAAGVPPTAWTPRTTPSRGRSSPAPATSERPAAGPVDG
ncbi:MAG: DUF4192 domain-containing protein [Actinocatenispora sp.]